MKHLNLELEKLEQRIAPWGAGGGFGSGSSGSGSSGSSKSKSHHSKSGGSKCS